jgi:hypothetical protein
MPNRTSSCVAEIDKLDLVANNLGSHEVMSLTLAAKLATSIEILWRQSESQSQFLSYSSATVQFLQAIRS